MANSVSLFEGIHSYWHETTLSRQAWNQPTLSAALLNQIQSCDRTDYQQGVLSQKLSGSFWAAPYVFAHPEGYCVPLWLPVRLQSGNFLPPLQHPLPWIPGCFLDPLALAPYLGSSAFFEHFLSELPATFNSWQDYVVLAAQCMDRVAGPDWQARFMAAGYSLQAGVWLRAKTPLPAAVSPNILMQHFLEEAYPAPDAEGMPDPAALHQGHAAGQPLDPAQRQTLHRLLHLPAGAIQAITTPIGTGKWALVAELIASEMVRTAIEGKAPPRIALYIPSAVQRNSALLTKPLARALPDIPAVDVPWSMHAQAPRDLSKAAAYFMEYVAKRLEQPFEQIDEAVRALQARVIQSQQAFYERLTQAQRVLQSLQDLNNKYKEAGGLEGRFENLRQADQKLVKAYDALAQAALLWEETQSSRSSWSRFLAGLPYFRNKLRDMVWGFYENHLKGHIEWQDDAFQGGQNLPSLLHARMRGLRSVRMKLQQELAPVLAEIQARDQLAYAWFEEVGICQMGNQSNGGAQIQAYLDDLRHQTYQWATHYWEGRWLQSLSVRAGSGPDPGRAIDSHAMLYHAFIMERAKANDPLRVDWLLIDEAHQWSAAEVSPLLYHAQRAVFFGDRVRESRQPILSRFEDEQWALHYGLAEDEEEVENLSADGFLSTGASAFALAILHSTHTQGDTGLMLTHHTGVAAAFSQYLNKNAYRGRLSHYAPELTLLEPVFIGIHVRGQSAGLFREDSNLREAHAIAAWISAHRKMILLRHPGMALEDCICVVTPFAGQQACLQAVLEGTVPIWQAEALPDRLWPIVIFSPVVTLQQTRPFVFDQQAHLMHAPVMLAQERVVVIGDAEIFDESMHSPSGQLAKCIQASGGFSHENYPPFPNVPVLEENWESFQNYAAKLAELLKSAQREVVIVSPSIDIATMEALSLVERIYRAVNRLVSVQVICSTASLDTVVGHNAIQAWVRAGVRFACVRQLYTSYIEVDGVLAYELCFDSLGQWHAGNVYHYQDQAVKVVRAAVLQPLLQIALRRQFKTNSQEVAAVL